MTGPSEVDPVVLAGEPGSAAQLERGDDSLPGLGQDPDEWAAADALVEGQPTELGESPER
jgi:hypothetical protein